MPFLEGFDSESSGKGGREVELQIRGSRVSWLD
jgi:hypothetical protein